MRQNNNEGTQEMISMEEYLVRRQEKRKTEISKNPFLSLRAAEIECRSGACTACTYNESVILPWVIMMILLRQPINKSISIQKNWQ